MKVECYARRVRSGLDPARISFRRTDDTSPQMMIFAKARTAYIRFRFPKLPSKCSSITTKSAEIAASRTWFIRIEFQAVWAD